MRKTYKTLISLCAVLISASALISVNAFADPFAGAVIGGMGAMGVTIGSTASVGGFSNFITGPTSSDPLNDWTSPQGDYSVYYYKNTKQKTESGQTIDYDSIWFSPDFVSKIQNSGISFINDKSIISNYSGTIITGTGYIDGLPVFLSGNDRITQAVEVPYGLGTYKISDSTGFYLAGNPIKDISIEWIPTQSREWQTAQNSGAFPITAGYWLDNNDNVHFQYKLNNGRYVSPSRYPSGWSPVYTPSSFNITYVSGTIDATPVSNKYLKFDIPSSILSQYVSDGQYTFGTSTEADNIILTIANGATEAANAGTLDEPLFTEDTPAPPPAPTPVPIPTDALGEVPFDNWYDLFGLPVLEGQEQIHQDLEDFSDQVQDGTEDIVGELEDIESDVESIDTNLGIGNGLLGDIKSIGQSIQSTLSSILSGVTDLVQEIVLSTETFIAGLLNSIMGGLGGWLSTMREAFSIWHYVVEWVGSISTVFSWFWSVAGTTSYYIQLPIYASLAGAVVLAFYKRFGK